MNSYVVPGTLNKVTYRYYNRRYTTPPIFQEYRFNITVCLTSIICAAVLLLIPECYNLLYAIDVALSFAYLFTFFVIKELYRNGILNAAVDRSGKSYWFAKFTAILTQSALYRTVVSTIYLIARRDISKVLFERSPYILIIGVCLGCFCCLTVFGFFDKKKFYTKSAQKAYHAIIEGPDGNNELDKIMQSSFDFKILTLKHPDMATPAFFRAQEKFINTAEQIRGSVGKYDEIWRRAIIYGGYENVKNFSLENVTNDFIRLCNQHRKNEEELNSVIIALNKKTYTRSIYTSVFDSTKKDNAKKSSKPGEPTAAEQLWNSTVNWYN